MHLGLQMYSVRDITKDDLAGALAKVKAIGYDNVEFAGFFGHCAEKVKAMLDETGLAVSGSHTGWDELTEGKIGQTIAFHKAIGNKRIIVPYADVQTESKISRVVDVLNAAQPKLAEAGIALGYHNHAHEFKPNDDGQIPFDELKNRTNIFFELDTFWVFAAGRDPLAMMRDMASRVPVVHIKDGEPDGEGKPLGLGAAPVSAVWKLAREMGIELVVESETLKPNGLAEADICYRFIEILEG
ncbi:MAG: sugar phosphate isomerase/epimerase [Oscillospiraceae bacterium]|jgi:sugar phosphate isomerase/epimerase|nr:sugar phosphate isomerase/epimerase [Oscillospiraceae bacterium]